MAGHRYIKAITPYSERGRTNLTKDDSLYIHSIQNNLQKRTTSLQRTKGWCSFFRGPTYCTLTGFVLKVPDFEGAIVTPGHHFHVVLQKPSSHHTIGMSCQCVLKKNQVWNENGSIILDPKNLNILWVAHHEKSRFWPQSHLMLLKLVYTERRENVRDGMIYCLGIHGNNSLALQLHTLTSLSAPPVAMKFPSQLKHSALTSLSWASWNKNREFTNHNLHCY